MPLTVLDTTARVELGGETVQSASVPPIHRLYAPPAPSCDRRAARRPAARLPLREISSFLAPTDVPIC